MPFTEFQFQRSFIATTITLLMKSKKEGKEIEKKLLTINK
jgi:hypothetical protein